MRKILISLTFREPLKIHFGGQANLFDSWRRQVKSALASAKADFPSLPEYKNLLLATQKQLLELPFVIAAIACLSLLAFVTGCVESNNSFGGEMRAVRKFFPSATNTAEISQGVQVSGRPDDPKISEIKGDLGLLGYRVESTVTSRSGPFRIRVLLDKQLYVKQASVISYPWDRGRDVCKHAFTSQFEGKGAEDPIQLGRDIDAMTGATISSRVMTDGVRRAVKIVSALAE